MKKYKNLRLYDQNREDLDAHIAEILEARRREKELAALEENRKAMAMMEEDTEEEE